MTDYNDHPDGDLPDKDCPGFPSDCDDCEEVGCDFCNVNKDIEDWLIHN